MKDIWIRGNIPMLGAHAQVKGGSSLHLQFPAMLRVSLGYNLFLERIFVTVYGFGWRVYLGSFFCLCCHDGRLWGLLFLHFEVLLQESKVRVN